MRGSLDFTYERQDDDCRLVTISTTNGRDRIENPSTVDLDDEQPSAVTSLVDKLKNSLNVRKKLNQKTLDNAALQVMSNYSEYRGPQKEHGKVLLALNKAKKASKRLSSQSKQGKVFSKLQEMPKPKTFAENLMSMLAKQTIGQAFSENPVEALTILKPTSTIPPIKSAGWENPNRRNSSQVQSMGQQSTVDSKFTSFPKLSEFKSATNNIYLQNRPVADPRVDSEYQAIDQKLKQLGNLAL